MVIDIPKIKSKLSTSLLILLPILLGLFNNFVFLEDSYGKIGAHLILFSIPLVFVIGAITSIILFDSKKKWFNYFYCIVSIVFTEYVVLEGALISNDNFGLKSFPVIILYLLYIYGIYLFFIGILKFKDFIKSRFRKWLRSKNIHIINSSIQQKLENKYPKLDLNNPINFEERFSKFNTDISEVNKVLGTYSANLLNELKLFEHDAITLKKKLISEGDQLLSMKEQVEKLEKIKNISEDQINALLEKQNEGKLYSISLGFILGILGSLIANYIYENISMLN